MKFAGITIFVLGVLHSVSADVEEKAPVFTKNSTSSVVVLREGQPMKLECYADGFPAPQITIRRENNAVFHTGESIYRGNKLDIDAVTKHDRGAYYCVADNGVGRSVRHKIEVEIEFPSVVTVPRPRVGQALQFDADLACHVQGYPEPAIYWYKDGVQLSYNDEHYIISNFATDASVVDSTLRVKKIGKEHYGQYVCKASNKLNSAEGSIELFETSKPICPPACNVEKIQQNIAGQDNSAVNASSAKEAEVLEKKNE